MPPDAEGPDRGPRYLGVDLAWTDAGWSGACVLDADGTILDEDQFPAAALVDWVRAWRGSQRDGRCGIIRLVRRTMLSLPS